jgi:hypothetical protein
MWAWLITSRAGRMVGGVFIALSIFWGIIAQQRFDARKKALRQVKEKDRNNADAIRDRVSRADDGLHKYDKRGFRD